MMMKTTGEQNLPNSAQVPTMRYPHSVRFVTHEKVEAAVALGYEWTSALTDTHHGEHAVLMIWPHDTDPPNV
jgi:hypothetical protein